MMQLFHSIRLRKARLTLISIACFVAILAGCFLALRAGAPDSVTVGGERVELTIRSDEEVEAFLRRCGCEIEGCVSDDEITVPKTWNAVYEEYNELQKRQGFDLRPYKGKPARKLVYALADSDDLATVLVCEGRIVGADIAAAQASEAPRALING